METKHTPGPWRVQATGHSFVVEAHTHTEVISVDANGNPCRWSEYNEANARLIAAAPELLEALQALLGWEEAEIKHFEATGPDDWIMEIARAAIAKATAPNAN